MATVVTSLIGYQPAWSYAIKGGIGVFVARLMEADASIEVTPREEHPMAKSIRVYHERRRESLMVLAGEV